nr:hypothetical protein [uncultured Desulfobacter sp.]
MDNACTLSNLQNDGETRKPKSIEYELKATVEEDPGKTEKIRLEAGCFILITNDPAQANEQGWPGGELPLALQRTGWNRKKFRVPERPSHCECHLSEET